MVLFTNYPTIFSSTNESVKRLHLKKIPGKNMIKCYNCLSEITRENKSLEHIIPNSIGGKLKSSTLLCRDCNSTFGETIDTELAKSYNNLVALLGINRDRQK